MQDLMKQLLWLEIGSGLSICSRLWSHCKALLLLSFVASYSNSKRFRVNRVKDSVASQNWVLVLCQACSSSWQMNYLILCSAHGVLPVTVLQFSGKNNACPRSQQILSPHGLQITHETCFFWANRWVASNLVSLNGWELLFPTSYNLSVYSGNKHIWGDNGYPNAS